MGDDPGAEHGIDTLLRFLYCWLQTLSSSRCDLPSLAEPGCAATRQPRRCPSGTVQSSLTSAQTVAVIHSTQTSGGYSEKCTNLVKSPAPDMMRFSHSWLHSSKASGDVREKNTWFYSKRALVRIVIHYFLNISLMCPHDQLWGVLLASVRRGEVEAQSWSPRSRREAGKEPGTSPESLEFLAGTLKASPVCSASPTPQSCWPPISFVVSVFLAGEGSKVSPD